MDTPVTDTVIDRPRMPLPPLKAAAGLLVACVLCIAAYSNTFSGSFHLDDIHQISLNPHMRGLTDIPGYFAKTGTNTSLPDVDFYRPVTTSTFALNYAAGGLDVTGYHVFNLALHILNTLLVFLVTGAVIRNARPEEGGYAALFVAAVFALHPIQTGAVTYISGRAVLLSGFFSLCSLYAFIRFRESSGRASYLWGAASPVFLLAGLFSKEMAVGAVGVMLVYDLLFISRERLRMPATWLYYLGFAGACAALAVARSAVGVSSEIPGMDYTVGQYLMSEAGVVLMYVRLLLFPAGQNADYMLPLTRSIDLGVLASAALIAAFAAWLVMLGRRRPAEAFFGAWFLVTLMPESSFFPILDIAVEYRLYLPSAGFIALCVLFATRAARYKRVIAPLGVGVVLVFGALTYNRNTVYANEYTFWSDVAEKSPGSARAANNLGSALLHAGRYAEAIPVFERALTIETKFPERHKIHINLGEAYRVLGRTDEAIEHYKSSIAAKPDFADAYDSLATTAFEAGRYGEAADAFAGLMRITGYDPQLAYNEGVCLMLAGRDPEAVEILERVVTYLPQSFDVRYNLGLLYERTGKTREAAEQARLAAGLAATPSDAADARALLERTAPGTR